MTARAPRRSSRPPPRRPTKTRKGLPVWPWRRPGWAWSPTSSARTRPARAGSPSATASEDFVGVRIDAERKLVEVPKPAGVILALTPSTNPVATVFFKVLLALMTRNAIVVSPHPMARAVCAEAVEVMARAAVGAGAPDGCLQVVAEPTIPLIEALMADPGTDLILATGGTAVVRAAYRSGNPSLGVGPGNVPALVDASADLAHAAECLAASKSFDNSILCTNESTVIAEEAIAAQLHRRAQSPRRPRARRTGRPSASAPPAIRTAASTPSWPARTPPRSPPRPRSGSRRARGCSWRRSSWSCPRSRWRARSCFRCSAWSRCADVGAGDRGRAGAAAHRRRRALGGHPLALAGGDPRLRRRAAGAARQRQRPGQHRILGPGHPPGADDDDRHRLLRPLVADREPAAPRPHAVDPARLRLRSRAGVRRLRGAASRGRRPRRAARSPARHRRPSAARGRIRAGLSRAQLRELILEELREVVRR